MSVIREIESDGWRIRLDTSRQVLHLEIPESIDLPLLPQAPLDASGPVSAGTLLLKAKHFDDGLYAAVEVAAQNGAGRFPAKASLLRSLAPASGPASALVYAACELGRVSAEAPAELHEAIRAIRDDFLLNEAESKPLGFYTTSAELSAIFRQDRLLQTPLDADLADALLHALETVPGAADAHAAWTRLASRLTNPPGWPGLRDAPDEWGRRAFFPPSRSHEVTYFERLYKHRAIPDGFDLMGELVRNVRSGGINLTPGDDAGWYDRQTWSLEPLLVPERMPESDRLDLGRRYRMYLEDLFRGALAMARETHAKQAGLGGGGGRFSRIIPITPGLTVEPLPAVYRRRADGYRFVSEALEEAFGAEALRGMRRHVPGRRDGPTLVDELSGMRRLFESAAATASREVGHDDTPGVDVFGLWRETLHADPDLARDARMMVPVFYDQRRRKLKVWAMIGWHAVPVEVSFKQAPVCISKSGPPDEDASIVFLSDECTFALPVMAEVYVTRLLNRDEFRRHCDRHRTRDAILANLR